MKAIFGIMVFLMLSITAHADDQMVGDTLIRTLSAGSASLVLFLNPEGESASTMVTCYASKADAKKAITDNDAGGFLMVSGSTIMFKKDSSISFSDGTNLKGTYIQLVCK